MENSQKDYRVKIAIRNNRILSLIERTHPTIAAFARDHRIDYGYINALISMKKSATLETGEWRKIVLELAEAFGVEPEEMFTELQSAGVHRSTVIRHVNEEEILTLDEPDALKLLTQDDPDRTILGKEIAALVDLLPERWRFVVEHRYGLNGPDMTYGEIGEVMNLSVERVRQIDLQAMRRLRRFVRGEHAKVGRV